MLLWHLPKICLTLSSFLPMNKHLPTSWINEYSFKRFELNLCYLEQTPHVREFHTLVCVKQGCATLKLANNTLSLNANQSIILKAGEILSLTPTNINQAVNIYFHHIDPIDVMHASDGQLLPSTTALIAQADVIHHYACRLFNSINKAISHTNYMNWLRDLVQDLNNGIANNHLVSIKQITKITSVRDFLLSNMESHYSLADIANEFNADKWNLSKSIRPVLGLSLQQQVHAAKIAQARHMLAANSNTSDVAHHLGYSDQSHFIRFFKRYSGTTPKKWSAYASTRQNLKSS